MAREEAVGDASCPARRPPVMNTGASTYTELRFVALDQWEAVSQQRITCAYPPFAVQGGGQKITVRPGMSLHKDLYVLGGDWIPYRPDGLSVIEQMVHTPGLYLPKARNIRSEHGRNYAVPARVRNLQEDAILIGGHANYYHWLIDFLPRVLFARKEGQIGQRKLLVNSDLQPYQLESLQLLGIPESQLLYVGPDEAVQLRSVLVPNLLSATTVCHPLVRQMLLEAYPPTNAHARASRIYLSRQDAATRRLVNEDAAKSLLARHGFASHSLASRSFQAQVDLFSHAEAAVAVHGAGMANTIFCRPGTRVVEIFSPLHKVSSMRMLAHIAGLKHAFVPSEVAVPSSDGNPLRGQWSADLQALAAALDSMLDTAQAT